MHGTDVLDNVRRALGRSQTPASVPPPPEIPADIARLVSPGVDLAALFTKRATDQKIKVETVGRESLISHLVTHLREMKCRRIALPISPLMEKLDLVNGLAKEGYDARRWDQISLDELYDFDAAVTDVYAAVAEVGGLVIRGSKEHGRALSLVPNVHVAIVEPSNLLPDLIDLFEKMSREDRPTGTVIITGPSKTADIEMNLVTGVHGPGFVKVFLLNN